VGQPEADRRTLPRYAVDTEATVVMVNHGPSLRGRIVELSLEGCRLRAERFCGLSAPASIELTFKLNGMGLRLGGTMQWADTQQMAGIQFSPMAPRRRDFLVELLSELEPVEQTEGLPGASPADGGAEEESPSGERGYRDRAEPPTPAVLSMPSSEPAAAQAVSTAPAPAPVALNRRDRRTQARHAMNSRATIYFVDVRAEVAGRIVDVSVSGCRIRTDERFPVGIYRRVEAEFTVDGLPFRLAGVVQSVHDKFTVGIRFLDVSARKRVQLEELIEDIEKGRDQG
jgi:hypothetical protein